MAINQLQIPSSNINNLVDQSQWSSLANLGNVYKQAQEDAAKQTALAQLGRGVDADAATLLHSGVPSLAQIGLNMQQSALNRQREDARYAVTDKRAEAELAIQQAAARRAQETYEKQDTDEAAAAKLIAGLTGRQPAQPAAPPSPFPAAGAPPLAVSPPVAQPPPVAPPIQQAVPLAPGQMPPGEPAVPLAPQVPPSPIDPSQLAATTSAAPPSVVDRITSNLTSGQPAATAGISRDQLAELYRNPITRPIATAFLQKQFSPGEWKYEKTEDGRIIAVNSLDPTQTKDVTPPTATGAVGSKQEREVQGYYQAGKNLGMSDDQARAYAANKGKMPSEDLHPDERKKIGDLTDMASTGQRVIDNINELKQISPKAWGFPGAQTAAEYTAGYLPSAVTPQGAVDTQDLTNAARLNVTNLAKSIFGARVTNQDLKLLQEVEGSANQTDAVRQKIFARATDMIQKKITDAKTEADAIRDKTFYKPGGGTPTAASTPTATAPAVTAPTAKPSLGEFMKRARDANPGASDGDLARYWKDKYGG